MSAAMISAQLYLNPQAPIEDRVEDALSRMTLQEKVAILHAQSKFSSPGVARLGIRGLWMTDGPHGIRPEVMWDEWNQAGWTNDSCTAFPALTGLAATWDPQLAYLYGQMLGEEANYRGKDVVLGPGVNIYRTPLNGRNFEYMGEDPYLASQMVVPYIQGLQSQGVAACVKHYALNNQEVNRHGYNVNVSDRALYEIYLPAYKAAVQQGGAWSIMGSYNLYKGQHACHNQYLLRDILRGEWGFDGAVVSDWGGAHDTDEAVANGLDLEFGTWTNGTTSNNKEYDNYYLAEPFLRGIQEGRYTMAQLDAKVRNVLRLIFRTSMNASRGFGSMVSAEHVTAAPYSCRCRGATQKRRQPAAARQRQQPHTGGGRECHQDDDGRRWLVAAEGQIRSVTSARHTGKGCQRAVRARIYQWREDNTRCHRLRRATRRPAQSLADDSRRRRGGT